MKIKHMRYLPAGRPWCHVYGGADDLCRLGDVVKTESGWSARDHLGNPVGTAKTRKAAASLLTDPAS